MAGLEDLPTELLEQIFLHLEAVEDMIYLGSSCSRLHQVLSQPRIWRKLMAKTKFINVFEKERHGLKVKQSFVNCFQVQQLMVFLKKAELLKRS